MRTDPCSVGHAADTVHASRVASPSGPTDRHTRIALSDDIKKSTPSANCTCVFLRKRASAGRSAHVYGRRKPRNRPPRWPETLAPMSEVRPRIETVVARRPRHLIWALEGNFRRCPCACFLSHADSCKLDS